MRNIVISLLLALLVLIVQLVAGNGWGIALLSAAIGAVIAFFVLLISDRYGRRDA